MPDGRTRAAYIGTVLPYMIGEISAFPRTHSYDACNVKFGCKLVGHLWQNLKHTSAELRLFQSPHHKPPFFTHTQALYIIHAN